MAKSSRSVKKVYEFLSAIAFAALECLELKGGNAPEANTQKLSRDYYQENI
jgi:hypothetical protein